MEVALSPFLVFEAADNRLYPFTGRAFGWTFKRIPLTFIRPVRHSPLGSERLARAVNMRERDRYQRGIGNVLAPFG